MFRLIYRRILMFAMLLATFSLHAQTEYPGGVSNVQVWLKPDTSIKTYVGGKDVDEWLNASVATEKNVRFTFADVKNSKKSRPLLTLGSDKMNFNSALSFDGTMFLASKTGFFSSSDAMTVFAIVIAEKEAGNIRMYYTGFGGTSATTAETRDPAIGFSPNENGGRVYAGKNINGSGGYVKNTTALQVTTIQASSKSASRYTKFRFNGADFSLDNRGRPLDGPNLDNFFPQNGITLGGASRTDGVFGGQLAEYVVFNRVLSSTDIIKIESYLGTKYGITLDGVPYRSSRNTEFWPSGRTGSGYHNNVAGIFRDDKNTDITVSRSTAAGAALTVSTVGTVFGVGIGVVKQVPLVNDDSAIYWGTNKAEGYVAKPVNQPGCGYNSILDNKYWKFKKTNLGATTVEVRAGGSDFPFQGPGYDVKMLVAKTEADAKNQNWLAVIPGTYVGGTLQEHLFNFPIDSAELYITFGATPSNGNCKPCQTSLPGYFDFSTSNWPTGSSSRDMTATNGIRFNVSYKTFSDKVENPSMKASNYPRVLNGNILASRFIGKRGSNDNVGVTNITFKDGATFAKFNIYGIDKVGTSTDEVEVIGYCGSTPYKPVISSAVTNLKDRTFTVGNGIITGIKSSSVTNKKGVAKVEFTHEVERIEIRHKITYRGNYRGYQDIGIGNFEFNCPRPAQPNPDGIEFTLQAPAKVSSCTDFTYTFKVWNYSCDDRFVKIEDELPEGMYWVDKGVAASDEAFSDAVFNEYQNNRVLSIDKVRLKASTFTTITAKVRFKEGAVPKVYENQGKLTYNSVNENKVLTIESCDYNTFESCQPTEVEMFYQEEVLSPVIAFTPLDFQCYRENQKITLKAKIKNPNKTIDFSDLSIGLKYNTDFIFKSFKMNATKTYTEEDVEGIHVVSDFSLLKGEELELTYEIEVLDFLALIEAATGIKYTDAKDVPEADILKVASFNAILELNGFSDNECVNASLDDVFTVLEPEIPFCGPSKSCYYPPVKGNVVKKNNDFVLLTTLDRSNGDVLETKDINALLYLESKSKGFVPTRLTEAQINAINSPVAGMLLYDTTNKCLKIYTGTKWGCISQSCPDN